MNQVSNNELIAKFLQSDVASHMQAQIIDEKLQSRQLLVDEIISLKATEKEVLPLAKKTASALKLVADAKLRLAEANNNYRVCFAAQHGFTASLGHKLTRLEHQLRTTAPAFITECNQWSSMEITRLKELSNMEQTVPSTEFYDASTGKASREAYSIFPSVNARINKLKQMIDRVNVWSVSALSYETMVTEFEQMKAGLPEVASERLF